MQQHLLEQVDTFELFHLLDCLVCEHGSARLDNDGTVYILYTYSTT